MGAHPFAVDEDHGWCECFARRGFLCPLSRSAVRAEVCEVCENAKIKDENALLLSFVLGCLAIPEKAQSMQISQILTTKRFFEEIEPTLSSVARLCGQSLPSEARLYTPTSQTFNPLCPGLGLQTAQYYRSDGISLPLEKPKQKTVRKYPIKRNMLARAALARHVCTGATSSSSASSSRGAKKAAFCCRRRRVVTGAISEPSSAPSTSSSGKKSSTPAVGENIKNEKAGSLPSLADYDEAFVEETIHDQGEESSASPLR